MFEKKILLIEDFPVIQELYGSFLREHKYKVDVVGNGEDGLQHLIDYRYDLVLLDVLLPKMNGIEVLRAMKEKGIDTPVIVLSDFDQNETVQEAYELGIANYYIKAEKTPHELLGIIKDYFKGSDSQQSKE